MGERRGASGRNPGGNGGNRDLGEGKRATAGTEFWAATAAMELWGEAKGANGGDRVRARRFSLRR